MTKKQTKKPKRAQQTEVTGARPSSDAEIDAEIEVLDGHRCDRLSAQKLEAESEKRVVALAQGKKLLKPGREFRYLMGDGDTLVIRPKSDKLGAYIERTKDESKERQTGLKAVE